MNERTRAINDHLASEFQASHTYLAMSIWLRENDLAGFSTDRLTRSYEERQHASRLIAYLVDSDAEVELPTVGEPLQGEAEARFVCKRLRLAGDNSAALLLLNQQFLEGTALSHIKCGLSGFAEA
ncbi:ferritin [Synechococcus sp. CS-1329]|uniref:ferritin-like domain-containing protein n=1 Tax=Synechococcus sp. CS-1329 TaxID=2847975 RepID=UPI00223B9183|nr:ferritin-like domain-containing protein [Synechococcus sp. CS-1329]MCT0217465.1 ferritin [Synechococcus sp. CS-1329]